MRDVDGSRVKAGIGLYVLAYAVSCALLVGSLPFAGVVLAAGATLAGLVLAIAGRTPAARGLGSGMLIGFGVCLLVFAACVATIRSQIG